MLVNDLLMIKLNQLQYHLDLIIQINFQNFNHLKKSKILEVQYNLLYFLVTLIK